VPLDPCRIRIALAPVEICPYNRHAGYVQRGGTVHLILGNRHIVRFGEAGVLQLNDAESAEDFFVHEFDASAPGAAIKWWPHQPRRSP
jgi:hypothetical protein